MAFYFSSDTMAFYDTDIFPVSSLPENTVEVSDADYAELMTKQIQGYVIKADNFGEPYTVSQGEAMATDMKHAASVATTIALGHVKIGNTMQAANDGTLDLKDGAVSTDKLATGAVTEEKLANGSVTEDKLHAMKGLFADETTLTIAEDANGFTLSVKDGGVSSEKIADAAVTNEKLATGAVIENKIAAGAVSRDKIAASALPKILSATCNESESYAPQNQFFEIGSISDNELPNRIADISLSGKIKLSENAGSSFDVTIYVYDTDVLSERLIETRTITVVGSDANYFNERFLIEKNSARHGSVNFFVRINLTGTVSFSEKRLKGILL